MDSRANHIPPAQNTHKSFIYPNKFALITGVPTSSNNTTTSHAEVGTPLEAIDIAFITQQTISLIINAPLLICIVRESSKRRHLLNLFFTNLVSVHIMLSIGTIVEKFYYPECSAAMNGGFFVEMFFSLIICSLDRYIYITYPFKYDSLSLAKIAAIIVTSWIISAMFIVFSILFETTSYQITAVSTVLILSAAFVLVTSNIHIYKIVRRHAMAILGNQIPSSAVDIAKESVKVKATYVCLILVTVFVVLWLPLMTHNVLTLLGVYEPTHEKLFTKIVFNVGCFNSIVDPLLYVVFRKDLRESLQKHITKPKVYPMTTIVDVQTTISTRHSSATVMIAETTV